MKKSIILLNVLILLVLLSTSCLATEFNHTAVPNLNTVGDEVMPINEDEQITNSVENPYMDLDVKEDVVLNDDDLYEIKDVISHTALTLDGNAYFMGESITIKDSMINGNAFIVAEKVELDNVEIYGSLYLIAETADLKITTLDVYAVGSNINIQKGSSILRGVRTVAESITVAGNIDKNCYLMGDSINLDSSIILGNLSYSAKEEIDLSRASITGNVNFNKIEEKEETKTAIESFFDSLTITKILSTILNTFIIAGLILLISDKFVNVNKNTNIGLNLGASLVIGIFALILIPIISIMLMISIVGFGIGVLLLIIYILLLINALPILSLAIALAVLKNKQNKSKWFVLGITIVISLVITVLSLIPGLSGLLTFLVCVLGLGIIVKTMFSKKIKEEDTPVQIIDSNNV